MYNRISTDDELIKNTFKRIKTIEERKDCYIINNKFQITKDGIVYYAFEYDGDINKDFPQYVFEIAEFIKEIEEQAKYLCMQDYQKGEFGMYRIYSMEGWRQQAIEWCDTDDNYEYSEYFKNAILDEKLIGEIAENWSLDLQKYVGNEEQLEMIKYWERGNDYEL